MRTGTELVLRRLVVASARRCRPPPRFAAPLHRLRLSTAPLASKNKHVLDRAVSDGKTPKVHASETHRVAKRRDDDDGWGWFVTGCVIVGSIIGWLAKGSYEGARKKKVVEEMDDELAVSPVEIYEVRSLNEFSGDDMLAVVDAALVTFPSSRATTADFTRFVMQTLGEARFARGVKRGYYLERLLYKLDVTERARLAEEGGDAAGDGVLARAVGDERAAPSHDVRLLLVAYSLLFNSGPWERLDNLLRAWPQVECVDDGRRAPYGAVDDAAVDVGDVDGGEVVAAAAEPEEEERCHTCTAVEDLVRHLIRTNQFPAEKLVARGERGDLTQGEPPLWTYHRASAEELVNKGYEELEGARAKQESRRTYWWWWPFTNAIDEKGDVIVPSREEAIRFYELVELLSTDSVCAWGECFNRDD